MFTFKELLQLYNSNLACLYFGIELRHENAKFIARVGEGIVNGLDGNFLGK